MLESFLSCILTFLYVVCTCIHMDVCASVDMCVSMCVHVCVHECVHMYTCDLCASVCVCQCVCAYECAGRTLMSRIIFDCPSILFIEAEFPNQTQSVSTWLVSLTSLLLAQSAFTRVSCNPHLGPHVYTVSSLTIHLFPSLHPHGLRQSASRDLDLATSTRALS